MSPILMTDERRDRRRSAPGNPNDTGIRRRPTEQHDLSGSWDGIDRRSGQDRRGYQPDPPTKPWIDAVDLTTPAPPAAPEPEAVAAKQHAGELDEALASAVNEANDLRDRWLRAAAELDNLRKRMARELEVGVRREREAMLKAFFEVLDNLDRAAKAPANDVEAMRVGIDGIRQQMLDTIKSFGAVPFEAEDEAFSPLKHEALATTAATDKPDGAIVQVVETGYATKDGTVIRPAKVVVARKA